MHLHRAVVDHGEGDIGDQHKPEIADPVIALEKPGDHRRRHPHEHHRERQPDDQRRHMPGGGAGHRQHVVEGHGDIGQRHVPDRGAERFHRALGGGGRVVAIAEHRGPDRFGLTRCQIAVKLPAHPRQHQPAGQGQPDDLHQLHGGDGEHDAEDHGDENAPEDHPAAVLRGDACRGHAHDDGVIAGQHQVDEHDLDEGADFRGREFDQYSPDLLPPRELRLAPPCEPRKRTGIEHQGLNHGAGPSNPSRQQVRPITGRFNPGA